MDLFLRLGFCGCFSSIGGYAKTVETPFPDEDPINFDQVGTKF